MIRGVWKFFFISVKFFIFFLCISFVFADDFLPGVGYDFKKSAHYVNPASLLSKKGNYLTYSNYFTYSGLAKNDFFEVLLTENRVPVGLSLSVVNFSEEALGGYQWQDGFLTLSSAFPVRKRAAVGIKLKYYLLSIPDIGDEIKRSGSGVSIDIGYLYHFKNDKWKIGGVLNNLISWKRYSTGTKEKNDAEMIIGMSCKISPNDTLFLDLSNFIDFKTSFLIPNATPVVSVGLEKAILQDITLKGALNSKGIFSCGIVLRSGIWEIGYLYKKGKIFEDEQQITITHKLLKEKVKTKIREEKEILISKMEIHEEIKIDANAEKELAEEKKVEEFEEKETTVEVKPPKTFATYIISVEDNIVEFLIHEGISKGDILLIRRGNGEIVGKCEILKIEKEIVTGKIISTTQKIYPFSYYITNY